jgi:hypothetical protein
MQFFRGFESVGAVRKVFGSETDEVIGNLKVEFCSTRFGYMAVSHKDAHLIVSVWHLGNSDARTLYLDLIHELFHVGQFRHEKDFFIRGYERLVRNPASYFTNPIEVAAYRHTVEEAKRIGLSVDEITEYLKVPWASGKSFQSFLKSVGLGRSKKQTAKSTEIGVDISKTGPITLHPFTDYFRGFESVLGIRRLFGDDTERVLSGLSVEFQSYPLDYVRMNDADGHLEVSLWHLRDSDISVLYLDIFLYLQFVSQFLEGRWDAASFFIDSTIWHEEAHFRDYTARLAGFENFQDFVAASKRRGFGFLDTPVAIEAYKATIDEARRIGMPEKELAEYVDAPAGPMTREAHRRFMRSLGIRQA